ncbi:hypothetical protein [Aliikangiella coralliicola]|uniref:Uncharacterized protein n=1 Tax=Aliikangiella coralliicola TaxID=2592383 RepID=A0A545U907_9GAMM|nr:hypothetical protein [Aliikangiella coralliicola]TQV85961.1 hypothetical protein FLL46_18770 [Aliikangiella coralliicola]
MSQISQALTEQTGGSEEPAWLADSTLSAVRPQVKRLLEQSPGFRELSADKQKEIAQNMVHVAAYMSNPQGLAEKELTPGENILAHAQADAVDSAKQKASGKIGTFAGADFQAGALEQGVEQFKELIGAVDFPMFVGGLIDNVFQAIVNASIQQMEAYADMLKAVAQTVDQFAQDNISLNNARDWLVDKFPGQLGLDEENIEENGSPQLAVQGDDEDAFYTQVNQEMELASPVSDISDPEEESRLVQAARLQMARSRQQLLASMVVLGINRIVITDGAINAKVVFRLKAQDVAERGAKASLYDRDSSYNRNTTAAGAHFGWGGAATKNTNVQSHMTAVSSSVDETSESKAEIKSKLSGEVRVNFKSDYFPMEKLASPGMISAIQGNATPFDPNYLPEKRSAAGSQQSDNNNP